MQSFLLQENLPKPLISHPIRCFDPFGSYLPAHASKAVAPQPAVNACLPDPGQVITVEEQVIPFFPARGKGGRGRGDLWASQPKLGPVFHLMCYPAEKQEVEAMGSSRSLWDTHPRQYSPVWEKGRLRLGVNSAIKGSSWWNRHMDKLLTTSPKGWN